MAAIGWKAACPLLGRSSRFPAWRLLGTDNAKAAVAGRTDVNDRYRPNSGRPSNDLELPDD